MARLLRSDRTLDIPDDFLPNRRDPPPQKRKLFGCGPLFPRHQHGQLRNQGQCSARGPETLACTHGIGISVIAEAELRFGVARKPGHSRLETAVEKFLLRVEILRWDSAGAKCYAFLRYALEPTGAPGNLALMIAAQVRSAPAMLVTHHHVFHRVKHLKVEDWGKAA